LPLQIEDCDVEGLPIPFGGDVHVADGRGARFAAGVREIADRVRGGAGEAEADEQARYVRSLREEHGALRLAGFVTRVRSAAERAAVSRWLGAALTRLPDSHFVITIRYAGYRGDAVLDGRFLELHVRDLEPEASRRFIQAWYDAVEAQASLGRAAEVSKRIADEQVNDLAGALFSATDRRAERLRRLVRNPLMLQIVCLVHRDRRRLPDRRVDLYDECVRVLLALWREAKGIPSTYAVSEALALLQPLAWWMHAAGKEQASVSEILPELMGPLGELRRPAEEGATFLEAIRRGAVRASERPRTAGALWSGFPPSPTRSPASRRQGELT
jgi:hypothetical protein